MPSCIASPPLLHHASNKLLSLHDLIGTSLKATSLDFPLSAMSDADSSLHDLIVTSLNTASFSLGAMRDTNSSPNDKVGTSLEAATLDFPLSPM